MWRRGSTYIHYCGKETHSKSHLYLTMPCTHWFLSLLQEEIEVALRHNGTGYVALGWKPQGTFACNPFLLIAYLANITRSPTFSICLLFQFGALVTAVHAVYVFIPAAWFLQLICFYFNCRYLSNACYTYRACRFLQISVSRLFPCW